MPIVLRSGASPNLASADLEALCKLGIDPDILAVARVRRASDDEARSILSVGRSTPGEFSGIEFPYLDPITGYRTSSRVRLDHPPIVDGKPAKYMNPPKDPRHFYFAPGSAELLGDTNTMVVLVEAEKSCLAICSSAIRTGRRVLLVAFGGIWNWKGRKGTAVDAKGKRVVEKGPLNDFDRIAWTGRRVVVFYDARPNDKVKGARKALGSHLRRLGAEVVHAHLPDEDLQVNGPDDYLGHYHDAALWTLIDGAKSEDFELDTKGRIAKDSYDNVRLALMKLGMKLTYDEFLHDVQLDGAHFDDSALNRLQVGIDDTFHFRPTKETLMTVIDADARQTPVHPVRQYLDGLLWDSEGRIDDWLIRYGGADDTPYTRAVGRLVLIAAVRRVRRPGCKFDELLVLESPQGQHKSSALRALCPDENWFSDDLPLGSSSKEVIERTAGGWIVEAAELHGNRGKEAEQLKAFLSRQEDVARLAYDRTTSRVPRQFIVIGTTNSAHYLKDMTGGRRFWPVRVQRFDLEALCRDRDQLWAEAALREIVDEPIRLDSSLWAMAGEQQEQRRAADPWEDVLAPLLEDGEPIPVAKAWSTLGVEVKYQDNRAADRVNAIMQRAGYQKSRPSVDGSRPWCWVRVAQANDPTDPSGRAVGGEPITDEHFSS